MSMTNFPNWMHLILLGGPDMVVLGLEVALSPLISASAAAEVLRRSSSASFRAISNISRSFNCGNDRDVSASTSVRIPPYGLALSSASRSVNAEGKMRWWVGNAGNLGTGGWKIGGGIFGALFFSAVRGALLLPGRGGLFRIDSIFDCSSRNARMNL